jgi:hypothetical protein
MKINTITTTAVAASLLAAASASAQLTLAFDINGFDYQFRDSSGAAGFGGTAHTGTVEWSYRADPATVIAETRMGDEGRFGPLEPVALGASLADVTGSLEFSGGNVMSGSLTVTLDNGDTYTTDIDAGSGAIRELTVGGWTFDAITFDGRFNDDRFGDIDVSEFFAIQGQPGMLPGSLFQFRFEPDAGGAGTADMEVFVLVPLPPAAYAGLATLAGVMGISYLRRRR